MELTERRVNRSDRCAIALDLLLESCRARGDFDALVIADADGLLVGASETSSIDPEVLACFAVSETRMPTSAGFAAQSFTAHGQRLIVAGLGGKGSGPLADAVRGAQRILFTH